MINRNFPIGTEIWSTTTVIVIFGFSSQRMFEIYVFPFEPMFGTRINEWASGDSFFHSDEQPELKLENDYPNNTGYNLKTNSSV